MDSGQWSEECTVERRAGAWPTWAFLSSAEQLNGRDVGEARLGNGVKRMGVDVISWRPYSPDLNSMENLWALEAEMDKPHLELEAPLKTNELMVVDMGSDSKRVAI